MILNPEAQASQNNFYPELANIATTEIDPIELAIQALAKLRAAGHDGIIRQAGDSSNLVNDAVIQLDDYRKPLPTTKRPTPSKEEREAPAPARTYKPQYVSEYLPKDMERSNTADMHLIAQAKSGDVTAMDAIFQKYDWLIRIKAKAYFLTGADTDDVIQEARLGLYKAVRDFRPDTGIFRSFAELCVTRQIITAVKTATRFKHEALNNYVSFELSPSDQEGDVTLGDALPGPAVHEPSVMVIASEELNSLVHYLGYGLSRLETDCLRLYLEGNSYEDIAEVTSCDTKSVDNTLQRVKRKIKAHQKIREVLL